MRSQSQSHATESEFLRPDLARAVEGTNLKGATLGDQLTSPVTLLVFLRHFG